MYLSDFARTNLTSDPPHQHQDDQNQKNQSKSTAGIVSPTLAVRPGRKCADEDENQNNDQYRAHVFPLFWLELLLIAILPISFFSIRMFVLV